MKIILFCHPDFLNSKSMPRFERMLHQAYLERGYEVDVWSPKAVFHRWLNFGGLGKWAGYIDQYIVFPIWVRNALHGESADTLFVFCDQALGPWVRLVADRPHAIHCHDFLALQSSLGEFVQHRPRLLGRLYQLFIRHGFRAGKVFISASYKSQKELSRFLTKPPVISEVVHNGLNFNFAPLPAAGAMNELSNVLTTITEQRMLVHVGGNVWYKNREGVVRIYAEYCKKAVHPLPLWMVGESPTPSLRALAKRVAPNGKVYFLSGLTNRQVQAVYSLAKGLIFPSIAEGFGWPIAEAMACGCPVLTTEQAPMTEVGGTSVTYIPVMPQGDGVNEWAESAADTLIAMLNATDECKEQMRVNGFEQVRLFKADKAISAYECIYLQVMALHRPID